MKKKFICKIGIDVVMTVLLLNRNWYGSLRKGKYTPVRIMQTIVNAAVFLSMLGMMVSGVILSREVFAFLTISGGVAFARFLHVVSAFWGYGAYAFVKNQILSYMFYTTHFVFFDFEKPVWIFFAEYIAIMGLFVFLAHYVSRGMRRLNGRRKL